MRRGPDGRWMLLPLGQPCSTFCEVVTSPRRSKGASKPSLAVIISDHMVKFLGAGWWMSAWLGLAAEAAMASYTGWMIACLGVVATGVGVWVYEWYLGDCVSGVDAGSPHYVARVFHSVFLSMD